MLPPYSQDVTTLPKALDKLINYSTDDDCQHLTRGSYLRNMSRENLESKRDNYLHFMSPPVNFSLPTANY